MIFNIGNGGVMAGTLLKQSLRHYRLLVNAGGVCIGLAMAMLLVVVRKTPASWGLAGFIALLVVILVSMPIGLTLSSRRHTP